MDRGNRRNFSQSGSSRPSFAPVNVGEELDVKIEAVGEKGDGIAKVKGFVLFIPNTNEGDDVRVRITKVLKKVGFAEVVGAAGQTKPGKEASEEGEEESEPEESDEESEEEESEDEEESEENKGEEDAEDSEDFGEDLKKK